LVNDRKINIIRIYTGARAHTHGGTLSHFVLFKHPDRISSYLRHWSS